MDAMIGKDLASMFADPFLTVAVSIGAKSTRGFLDQLDEFVQDPSNKRAQVRSTVVTIKKDSLGVALVIDAAIKVDTKNYKVREYGLSDDGLMQHVKVA